MSGAAFGLPPPEAVCIGMPLKEVLEDAEPGVGS